MAIETTGLRSRRTILAGTVGALAAGVAGSLGRAQPVVATTPAVLLGVDNPATSETSITSTSGGDPAISGFGGTGVGVRGSSNYRMGVNGTSNSPNFPGVLAWSLGWNSGLQGYSGDPFPPASPAKTGVYGYAAQDASARGVIGETTAGRGINGIATSGTGVFGTATTGEGMRGESTGSNGVACKSTSGIGVYGESAGSVGVYGQSDSDVGVKGFSSSNSALYGQSDTGYALEAIGRLKLSTAGIATIPAGSTSKVITSFLLTAGSFLLLTPGVDIGTRRLWFTKNVAAHTITIHLSSSRTTATKISWLLVG